MNIPPQKYSLESFLEYIARNGEEVFGPGQLKWLKGHLLYVRKDWRNTFAELNPENYGELTKIVFPNKNESVDFYAYEWAKGIIMMFTSSTEKLYEKTLEQFIRSRQGISPAWIRPVTLDHMKNYMITKFDARIYRFISRRQSHWKTPARIRPNEDRRISYSGNDANEALKELQSLYGVIPMSMDMYVGESKMQINRDGLFLLRRANLQTVGVLQEIVQRVIVEQTVIRDTSEKFDVATRKVSFGGKEFNVPRIAAGKIILPRVKLSEPMVNRMFGQDLVEDTLDDGDTMFNIESDFSFIDTYVREDPMMFRATVVDEEKGTVFGLSGIENEISLIPKHRTTFESFIKFYNAIVENFDDAATLTTFSEPLIAR